MKIIKDFEEIPKDKTIGLMVFEDKRKSNQLHEGYITSLKTLRDKCDIVVVDVIIFRMLAGFLYRKIKQLIPFHISAEKYEEYFNTHADYIVMQEPEKQLQRFTNKYTGIIDKRCQAYPIKYRANEIILKTFLQLFSAYPFKIDYSVNMWKCGFRSFLYKHYLETYLGVKNMEITDPPRNSNGLIPTDTWASQKSKNQSILTQINNEIRSYENPTKELIEKLKMNKNVSQVHLFWDNRYADKAMVEILLIFGKAKARIVHYYGEKKTR